MKARQYRMIGFVLLCSLIVFASCSNVKQNEEKLIELQQQLRLSQSPTAAGPTLLDQTIQQYEWLNS